MGEVRPHERPWAEWIRERDDWRSAHGKPEALDDLLVVDGSSGHLGGCFCSSTSMRVFFAFALSAIRPRSSTLSPGG